MRSCASVTRWLAVLGFLAAPAALSACQAEDDRAASYEYIQAAILAPQCGTVGCHSEYGDVRGYHFDVFDDAYQTLTGGECGVSTGPGALVIPGMPEQGLLIFALRGGPGIERQMPPDRPLPEKDIELIQQWVMDGAECN